MEKLIDANDPSYLLGIMKNIENYMPKSHRKNTANWVLVKNYLLAHTIKGGSNSSFKMCEYIGIDPDAYSFY
jgi:hypothetical protein